MTAPGPVRRLHDGSAWEELAGYCRAVRRDVGGVGLIAVSGTTASAPDGSALHPGDSYAQTAAALERALAAVARLGGSAADVVRTRLLLTPDADWREAVRAHAERFAACPPANSTYTVAALIGPGFLVEVEIDAVVGVDGVVDGVVGS